MSEAWHMATRAAMRNRDVGSGLIEGETACGLLVWGVRFSSEDVTCLRCRGTREFQWIQESEEAERRSARFEELLAKTKTKRRVEWLKKASKGGSKYRVLKVGTISRRGRLTKLGSQV